MGRRGPPRKSGPREVVETTTKRKRRRSKVPPPPPVDDAWLRCPDHLEQYARLEWERHARELAKRGRLEPLYLTAFEMYCQTVAKWRTYEKLCEKVGPEDAKKLGYERSSRDWMKEAARLGARFGLDPTSVGRVTESQPDEDAGTMDTADDRRQRFFGIPGKKE